MEKPSASPPNTPPLRAAQYVRMSTEHQQYSPENQLEIIRLYATTHQMEIVREYSDHGRSGLNIAGREGLNTLMADVEGTWSGVRNSDQILIVLLNSCAGRAHMNAIAKPVGSERK